MVNIHVLFCECQTFYCKVLRNLGQCVNKEKCERAEIMVILLSSGKKGVFCAENGTKTTDYYNF